MSIGLTREEYDEEIAEYEKRIAELEAALKLVPDLTTIMRIPNAEHYADKHNAAVKSLRLAAGYPKEQGE